LRTTKYLVKTPLYRNSENIGTIILHQLKKLIEKISSNPNGWQGIWSTTIETDREFFC